MEKNKLRRMRENIIQFLLPKTIFFSLDNIWFWITFVRWFHFWMTFIIDMTDLNFFMKIRLQINVFWCWNMFDWWIKYSVQNNPISHILLSYELFLGLKVFSPHFYPLFSFNFLENRKRYWYEIKII